MQLHIYNMKYCNIQYQWIIDLSEQINRIILRGPHGKNTVTFCFQAQKYISKM